MLRHIIIATALSALAGSAQASTVLDCTSDDGAVRLLFTNNGRVQGTTPQGTYSHAYRFAAHAVIVGLGQGLFDKFLVMDFGASTKLFGDSSNLTPGTLECTGQGFGTAHREGIPDGAQGLPGPGSSNFPDGAQGLPSRGDIPDGAQGLPSREAADLPNGAQGLPFRN